MPPENLHPHAPDAVKPGSDASFRLLTESVEDFAILLLDPLGNLVSWNPGAARLTGYGKEEAIGRHFSFLYPQEALDRELPELDLAEAARHGHHEDEGWRVRKDGTRLWAGAAISALRDSSGTIIGFANILHDRSARKVAAEEIGRLKAQSENRAREQAEGLSRGQDASRKQLAGPERAEWEMARFFDLSLDMICIAGLDGYFKKLNPAWEKALGYSREELLAQPFVEFIHPDDRAATSEVVREMDEGSDVIHFENRYRHKDGTYRWFAWKAPAVSPGEDFLYATARDVTERRNDALRHPAPADRSGDTGRASRHLGLGYREGRTPLGRSHV
jgi:PAS domain S-box-containing protein